MKNIEKLDKVLWSFLVETFEFIDEQTAAIDYRISMTQEIYDSILDRCMELGSSADRLSYWLACSTLCMRDAGNSTVRKFS
ncbi:hypothetical protein NDGK_00069 [Clostridiales bacterium CHKCI001]|nr:hypothetical protein NDGK_00069 [Clostridiales bacterium CHKCI001]